MSARRTRVSRDLRTLPLPRLSSVDDELLEDRLTLFRHAESWAIEVIEWYLRRKRSKARWSRILRALSIILLVAGGLIPLTDNASSGLVVAEWGYVLIALAAGCVAYDRFFGLTSGWMRFMSTQLRLQSLLRRFQHSWYGQAARVCSGEVGVRTADLDATVEQFYSEAARLISDETHLWAVDLEQELNRVDDVLSTN